jgi:hypothetical protein
MKNLHNPAHGPLELRTIISRLATATIPYAVQKQSFLVNEVSPGLKVNADEHMLAAVFGSLLNTVISCSSDCCIRISAKLYGRVALIHLKENPGINNFHARRKLKEVQQLAEMFGGTVSIGNGEDGSTSIVFSFINHLSLAA